MSTERTRRSRPSRARPPRHRTGEAPRKPRSARPADEVVPDTLPEEITTKTGDGGASGHGPVDDDGHRWGREPDGDGENDRGPLLIVLGILSLGAAVLAARVLTARSKRGALSHWRE